MIVMLPVKSGLGSSLDLLDVMGFQFGSGQDGLGLVMTSRVGYAGPGMRHGRLPCSLG
jgi:hypothetical protein